MTPTAPTGPARPPSTASPAGAAWGTSSLRAPGQQVLVRWLLEVTRPVLRPLLGSVACRVVGLLAGTALLALGAYAVADAAVHLSRTGAPGAPVWAVVAAMAVLALLKAALRYAEQFLGHLVAFKALELLRAELFRSLLPRSPRLSAGSRSGDLLARATKDIDRIEVFFAHTLAPAASAVVVPATVLVVVGATTSWVVALAVLPLLAAQLVLVPAVGARASVQASRVASRQRAALTHHVKDTVQAMGDIVGYGRERQRLEQLAALDAGVASALRPSTTWASLRRGASQALGLAAPVVVVAVGAGGVGSGSISLPALAAAAAAVLRLSGTAQGAEALVSALAPALASAERVWEVVHAPVERHDGTRELSSGISHEVLWQGVSYTYPDPAASAALDSTSGSGSRGSSLPPDRTAPAASADHTSRTATNAAPALSDVSLRARAGRWTCVVGASGSGKSTLAMLVLRCEPSGPGSEQTGRVLLDGIDVRDLRSDSLYREVALVPQHAHLFRACVADNVRLAAPSASDEEVREACRAAAVHEEVEALPHGYDTLVGERGETLSGGQRQRLALARALLARPNLLVLDELSSHLDPQAQARVRAGVRRYLPEATVVEITHQVRQSVQADHVVVLDAGRVVQEGSPAVLLKEDGPLRTLSARG